MDSEGGTKFLPPPPPLSEFSEIYSRKKSDIKTDIECMDAIKMLSS